MLKQKKKIKISYFKKIKPNCNYKNNKKLIDKKCYKRNIMIVLKCINYKWKKPIELLHI